MIDHVVRVLDLGGESFGLTGLSSFAALVAIAKIWELSTLSSRCNQSGALCYPSASIDDWEIVFSHGLEDLNFAFYRRIAFRPASVYADQP